MNSACTYPNCSCKSVGRGVVGCEKFVVSKSRIVPDPPSPSDLRAVMEFRMELVASRPRFGFTYVDLKVVGEPDITLWYTKTDLQDEEKSLTQARHHLARAIQQIMEEHSGW